MTDEKLEALEALKAAESRMGWNQIEMLRSLDQHGSWWNAHSCRWCYDTMSGTKRILDALVKRGLVTWTKVKGRDTYFVSALGEICLDVGRAAY